MSESMAAVRLPEGKTFHVHDPRGAALVYKEIFQEREYLRHGVCVRDGDCVLDVGANIGLFSLFVHDLARGVRIHAFEPAPALFEVLARNARAHFPDAALHACGLAESSRMGALTFYPRIPQGSTYRPFSLEQTAQMFGEMARLRDVELAPEVALAQARDAARNQEVVATPLRALSDVIADEGLERVDLLKVDVEGSEWDVLAGLRDEHWPRIRQIVLEVHNRQNGRSDDIEALLRRRGFRVTVERKDRDPLLALFDIRMMYAVRAGQA
jgi:phthiocerol/phenolphthiocerol synthesis type-I polyketide synthase E